MAAEQTTARGGKKLDRVDALLAEAEGALREGACVRAESRAANALRMAHTSRSYAHMERAIPTLKSARAMKREQALKGELTIVEERRTEESPTPGTGWYLFRPPNCVGADGRSLRDAADEHEVPVAIVVHEPRTMLGELPIVMIGPCTVRARVMPTSEPDKEWFVGALEALGDAAIEDVEPDLPASVRVDRLLDRLETVRDHGGLHDALLSAVREAKARAADDDD